MNSKLLYRYKLEKRISKLEKLIIETHDEDLSKLNDLSVLELACKDHNIDTMIAILANDTQNVIKNPSAIINQYYGDVPNNKDVVLLAASKESSEFNKDLHSFYCVAYGRKIISKKEYKQIIDTVFDNCKYVSHSDYAIGFEIKHGILNAVKKIADKAKILVRLNWIVYNQISVRTAYQLLELCRMVSTGELSMQWKVSDFISVCRFLCKKVNDSSFMSNMINSKFLSSLDRDVILSLFYLAVEYNDVNTLSKLISAKVKLKADEVLDSNYLLNANKEITKLAIRLIDKNTRLSKSSIGNIASCNNEYLVNYAIGMGYGEDLLACCIEYRLLIDDFQTAIKVLEENGFEIPDDNDKDSRKNIVSRAEDRQNITRIIRAIENDEWSRSLNDLIDEHPEVLSDEAILDAIRDNNTATSRQLQRRIDRLPKNTDVYDM